MFGMFKKGAKEKLKEAWMICGGCLFSKEYHDSIKTRAHHDAKLIRDGCCGIFAWPDRTGVREEKQ